MIELVLKLLNDGFLASFAASVVWDGVKAFFKTHPDEEQTWKALCSSLKRFYELNGWSGSFDEKIVLPSFVEGYKKFKNPKWHLRDILEYAIGDTLLHDRQFKMWINLFEEECKKSSLINSDDDLPFSDRETKLIEIRNKLIDNGDEKSFGDFSEILTRIVELFNTSWKTKLLEIFDTLEYNEDVIDTIDFIHSSEICDHIVREMKRLIDTAKWKDETKKTQLKKLLEQLCFNKILLVSGTSGSGKSHFIHQYCNYSAKLLQSDINVTVPCFVETQSLISLYKDIITSLQNFVTIELPTLEEYLHLLDALHIRICFVVENVNTLLNAIDDWRLFTGVIRRFSRYEQFRFIITINEYEYYYTESDQGFLKQYCVDIPKHYCPRNLFRNVLSIDQINQKQGIINKILNDEYKIFEYLDMISTPQEAIYFGECITEERSNAADKVTSLIAPPSTYFEFVEKIANWKSDQLQKAGSSFIEPVLNEIIKQKKLIIYTALPIKPFLDVQLLSLEKQKTSLFKKAKEFHLRIYPFWAVNIVCYDFQHLQDYPEEMKEWLVPCFIFKNLEMELEGVYPNYQNLFGQLYKQGLFDQALFCSRKATELYIRQMNVFLDNNPFPISTPKLSYALLLFIHEANNDLEVVDRLKLCLLGADSFVDYGLTEIYRRVLENILRDVHDSADLVEDMLMFVKCQNVDINHINGYVFGERLLNLSDKKIDILGITNEIVKLFAYKTDLLNQIVDGNKHNFMDYLLRKIYEVHIGKEKKSLNVLLDMHDGFFSIKKPIGSFIKRNFVCAAGNLFEKSADNIYKQKYIRTVQKYAASDKESDRQTAWFLICNSIGEDSEKLDPELRQELEHLMLCPEIMRKFGEKIKILLNTP